jgi:hypothetical protein
MIAKLKTAPRMTLAVAEQPPPARTPAPNHRRAARGKRRRPRRRPCPEVRPAAVLLTPEQLAEKLCVPQTWVREKTRERARQRDKDPLPVVRLGKYVRFSWPAVEAWLARQRA